ncbi:MAG: HlyD family efflux transporter periplasmic adaptor subunit [Planctomycetota bacterium]
MTSVSSRGVFVTFLTFVMGAITPAVSFAQRSTDLDVGNAIAKVQREANVCFEVSGILTSMSIKEGQQVEEGQVLASLSDTQVKFEINRKKIELSNANLESNNSLAIEDAKLASAVAMSEYERVLEANRVNSRTYRDAEVERFKLLADRSKLAVSQAQHEAEKKLIEKELAQNEWESISARAGLYSARAPWKGKIVAIEKNIGEWVEPGTTIARLIDDSRMRIEGFVSSIYHADDLVGCPCSLSLGETTNSKTEFTGEVVFVSPEVNPVNLLSRVFIEVDNPGGRIRPGIKVRAVIDLAAKDANDSFSGPDSNANERASDH